jgi:ATP-dependent RNA helicase DDX56/DBP9
MATKQFADLGLDPRLMRALSKKAYTAPTPVQAEAIPKSLEGRDIVARARTGSGKTMAYLLPALHKLLGSANTSASFQVIVLVPTRELCEQVRQEAHGMAVHCGAGLSVTSLGNETTDHAACIAVSNAGQLVITTPGRLATALKDKTLPAAHLHEHLQVRLPRTRIILCHRCSLPHALRSLLQASKAVAELNALQLGFQPAASAVCSSL